MREKESKKLAKAIYERDSFYIRALLDQGVKLPSSSYLYMAFGFGEFPEYKSEIVDWLASKNALPEGVTPASLKAFIWYNGNDQNAPRDFLNQPDFNPDGCPGLATPMQLSTQKGRVDSVRELIALGAKSRPLTSVFFGSTDHSSLDRGDFEIYKTELSENLNKISIRKQCEIADLFFLNPTEDLIHKIDQIREDQFLMFFCWAAKNNRADLLKTNFARLFVKFPKEANLALRVAVLFGSKAFVEAIIMGVDDLQHNTAILMQNLLGPFHPRFRLKQPSVIEISQAMCIATRTNNLEILFFIVNILNKKGITLKDFSCNPDLIDTYNPAKNGLFNNESYDFLLHALEFNKEAFVLYFLKSGAFVSQSAFRSAISKNNIRILSIILSRDKTNLSHLNRDFYGEFPLHFAIKQKRWDIAEMFIRDHGADIYARDFKERTPLDYIDDQDIKERFLALSRSSTINEQDLPSPTLNDLFEENTEQLMLAQGVIETLQERREEDQPEVIRRDISPPVEAERQFGGLNAEAGFFGPHALFLRFFAEQAFQMLAGNVRSFAVANPVADITTSLLGPLALRQNPSQNNSRLYQAINSGDSDSSSEEEYQPTQQEVLENILDDTLAELDSTEEAQEETQNGDRSFRY